MSSGKRVLGRGLADLIPVGGDGPDSGGPKEATIGLAPGAGASVQEAPIATLRANPRQPRTHFDDGALQELAASIQSNGILQPILVRPRTPGGFEIVAGERRYRAALLAGLKTVPIIVRELTDAETLAVALIENLIREDIGPLETARAFQRLMEDFGWTQEEMGRRVGKSRPAVSNALRLLELPLVIQQSLERGEIMEGHARALLGDRTQREAPLFRDRQTRVFQQVIARGLSVRDVERLMREGDGASSARPSGSSRGGDQAVSRETSRVGPLDIAAAAAATADRRALEDRLREVLGTQVRITGTDDRGRIEIEYFSADDLDSMIARLEEAFRLKAEKIVAPPPARGAGLSNLIPGTSRNR